MSERLSVKNRRNWPGKNFNIKVAEYITKYLPKELLKKKLQQFAVAARERLEHREINVTR